MKGLLGKYWLFSKAINNCVIFRFRDCDQCNKIDTQSEIFMIITFCIKSQFIVIPQPIYRVGPVSSHQQNAIQMVFQVARDESDPLLYACWSSYCCKIGLVPHTHSVLFVGHRQTVETQIRRHRTRRLTSVFTVCLQKVILRFD